MEPFIKQLIELVQNNPTRRRWIIVPSAGLGHTLAERIVREGVDWTNLQFTTAPELAERIAGPLLARDGFRLIELGLGPALILELLLDLPPEVPRYFRTIAEQPGVADALWTAVCDLRLAGLAAADLSHEAFTSPDKHAELTALLASYERYLQLKCLTDSAACLKLATSRSNQWPVADDSQVLELPGSCRSVLERDFLDSLRAEHLPSLIPEISGVKIPEQFEQRNGPIELIPVTKSAISDSDRLAWIGAPGGAPGPIEDGSLRLFRAAGREAEVEEVLRRIQLQAQPYDSIEIICAQPREYAPLFWEKAMRYEIPVTLEMGIPGTLTRPVRAAMALCDWIESDFAAVRLARMFDANIITPSDTSELHSSSAARVLRQSGATVGRATYATALAALAAASEERSKDTQLDDDMREHSAQRAARARALAEWITRVLDSFPQPGTNAEVALGVVVGSVRSFIDQYASIGGSEDVQGRSGVREALDMLMPLADLVRPLDFVLALIRARLGSISVAASRPRPGALHVSTLAHPGYSGREVTFVVGLEEGAVFPAGLEDPVLLDAERSALAPDRLTLSSEVVTTAVWHSVSRIASLCGRVTLSYSCRDLRQGRQTYPSWLIFHVYQLLKPGARVRHEELGEFLGDPATMVPARREEATSDLGWWLSGLRGAGTAAMPAVAAAFPGISDGLMAESARQAAAFTPYDGLVPQAGADLDPRNPSCIQSASSLERYARCPFRFFLEKGLGLDPAVDEEPDLDAWLDPLTRGDVLHRIYRDFMRRLRSEGRGPLAKDWGLLFELARERLEGTRNEIPSPSDAVYAAEMEQVERDLRLFLRLELERKGAEPVAIEVPFGFGEPDPEEPLSQPEPVTIDLGDSDTIRLRGRIDRIDRLPQGFEVIDYKTGVLWREQYQQTFAGGTLLQHALYSGAARRMLVREGGQADIVASSYYFCTEKGWGERVSKPGKLDGLLPVLRAISVAIGTGTFVRGGNEASCRHCDYRHACPGSEVRQAEQKRSGQFPGLAALEKLAAYE